MDPDLKYGCVSTDGGALVFDCPKLEVELYTSPPLACGFFSTESAECVSVCTCETDVTRHGDSAVISSSECESSEYWESDMSLSDGGESDGDAAGETGDGEATGEGDAHSSSVENRMLPNREMNAGVGEPALCAEFTICAHVYVHVLRE